MRYEQVLPVREARRRIAIAVAGTVADHVGNRFKDISPEDLGLYRQAVEAMVVKGLELEATALTIDTMVQYLGIEPTETNVAQARVLLKALVTFDERNTRYKDQWKGSGWRGAVYDCRKKAERLFRQYWEPSPEMDDTGEDDAVDLINFAAFFLRGRTEGNEWGTWL